MSALLRAGQLAERLFAAVGPKASWRLLLAAGGAVAGGGDGAQLRAELARLADRAHPPLVCVVGGAGSSYRPSTVCECLDESQGWRALPSLPLPRDECAVVGVGSVLYVLGGKHGSRVTEPLTAFDCLDTEAGSWESLPPMRAARCSLAVAYVCGMVYAVGGFDGKSRLRAAERYNLATSRWELLRPLPQERCHCAAAELGCLLYVAGGFTGRSSVRDLLRFDPRRNGWEAMPRMGTPRSSCAAAEAGGRLCVVGGDNELADQGEVGCLDTAELYDPSSRSWTTLPTMRAPRMGLAVAAAGDRVFALGGIERTCVGGRSSGRFELLGSVEVLDIGGWLPRCGGSLAASGGGSAGWVAGPPLRRPRTGAAAAAVRVPAGSMRWLG